MEVLEFLPYLLQSRWDTIPSHTKQAVPSVSLSKFKTLSQPPTINTLIGFQESSPPDTANQKNLFVSVKKQEIGHGL